MMPVTMHVEMLPCALLGSGNRRWIAQQPLVLGSHGLYAPRASSTRRGPSSGLAQRQFIAPALAFSTGLLSPRRRVLAVHRAAAVSAAAVAEEPPAGGRPQQQPPAAPPSWLGRLAQRVAAVAVLYGVALIGAASPAHASREHAYQPSGAQHAVLANSEAYSAACGARDTGILLAAAGRQGGASAAFIGEYGDGEVVTRETDAALAQLTDDKAKMRARKLSNRSRPSRGGRKVDPKKSVVPNPNDVPSQQELEKKGVVTAWRADKLKNMTYTQFLNLVKEGRVEKVRYTDDRRSVYVTTKASAPGGARTEKVALAFDPGLFDTMVENGVYIETPDSNPILPVLHSIARLVFPIAFSFLLIKFAFRLGRKQKRDKIFGGAKLQTMQAKDAQVTFKDIAGVDQVKSEIMEIVEFLRNPQRFLDLGAKSPAGVLLVGPPGTGKTLLAKAIAGEAGVPFFSVAGTEFMEMFVGVGAARVRDMFQQARRNAPCILFIDEFDGLGKARSPGGGGNDESVHTINQLLTEMDGFEDNTGVVIMAATNRPAALDQALTRPGRFDRIVHLPLPNMEGRVGILKVHARNKKVDPNLDYAKLARATAGFTGAELMNLMNQSAIVAVRQQQPLITEAVVFEALEKIHRDKLGRGGGTNVDVDAYNVPDDMRRTIAVYEAGRALVGYITPDYDEIQRVSVCPQGMATGYTYFLPKEEVLESRVVTRGYMEARMVVCMAGRCAERLVLGEAQVSTAGAKDLEQANIIAREMVYRCGFSSRLGPVSLMENEEVYINKINSSPVANISTELAKVAYADIEELVEAAEAKAYYGLASNYRGLEALYSALLERGNLTGEEVAQILQGAGVKKFEQPDTEGFRWGDDGGLEWPGKPEGSSRGPLPDEGPSNGNGAGPKWWSPKNPYRVRTDIPNFLELR